MRNLILLIFILTASVCNAQHHAMFTLAGQGGNEPLLSGLITVLEFNETSGTTAYDAHGSNDAANTGATVNQNSVSGLGRSYSFMDDFANMGNPSDLIFDIDVPFSVSVWFFPLVVNHGRYILSKRDITHGYPMHGFMIYLYSTSVNIILDSDEFMGGQYIKASGALTHTIYQWYNLVFTFDGSGSANGLSIYINGVPATITTSSSGTLGSILPNPGPISIGAANLNDDFLRGYLDQLAFWDIELTQKQVTTLYQRGNGFPYSEWE